MPSICAVTNCKNYLRKRKGKLHTYNFPKDATLRKTWIRLCSPNQYIEKINSKRVCSDHFKETDFENWMQYRMMGGKMLYLKKNAVPSQNLPCREGSLSPQQSPTDLENDEYNKNLLTELLGIKNHEEKDEGISSIHEKDETLLSTCTKSINNLDAIEIYYEQPGDISEELSGSTNISDRLSGKSKEAALAKSNALLLLNSEESSKANKVNQKKSLVKSSKDYSNSDKTLGMERKILEESTENSDEPYRLRRTRKLFPKSKPVVLNTENSDQVTNVRDKRKTKILACTDSSNNSNVNEIPAASSVESFKVQNINLDKSKTTEIALQNSNTASKETQQIPASAPIKVLLLTTTPLKPNHSDEISKENEQLKQKIAVMQKQINVLKKQNNNYAELRAENLNKRNTIKRLERQLNRVNKNIGKNTDTLIDTEVRKVLSKVFSETQMKLLLERQKRVYWSEQDIATAFTILYSSKRCYVFLREKLHYPLPGLSTLRRWTQKIHSKKGSLDGVIRLLEVASGHMSNLDKLVVLQYGKVNVAHKYEYDKETDEVIGPHKYMQVVIARSLYGKWKQPIFADFNKRIDTVLLNELFTKLHKIGIRVVACVSDAGLANARLWQTLGISWETPWICHPCMDIQKIFFFADASHMLKLLRNSLLDSGFLLKNGVQITNRPLVELLSEEEQATSKCGITKKHIECLGRQREDISLAVELLSPAVSYALIGSPNKDSDYDDLASFIDTVINWFDIMYSASPTKDVQTESGYGRSDLRTFQDACLDKAFEAILYMRCISEKNLATFQEGILFSIKSLQELFTSLKEEFDVPYISMDRLSLGALENLFSQLKTESGSDPTPLHALSTLRKIVLSRKSGTCATETNTVQDKNEEYLVNEVLDDAGIEMFSSSDRSNEPQSIPDTSDNELSGFPLNDTTQSEEYSLRDWAEWITRKLCSSHPHLIKCTTELTESKEHSYHILTQIEPTQEFLQEVEELDKLFCRQTDGQFANVKNITKKLVKDISAHSKTDKVIIQTFVEQRILARIKYLNMRLTENKFSTEKRKLDNQKIKPQLNQIGDKKRKLSNKSNPTKQLKHSTT